MSSPPDKLPLLEPREAIEFFRAKGLKVGFAWQDVWQEEHARAFTVAKAMSRDVLETIRAAVDQALAKGETLEQFRAQLTPLLQQKGWWGRTQMIDPATGLAKSVQLGSPRRLKIIYEMNMRMAQAAGRWEQIQRTKKWMPYLRYVAVMDDRTRPEHREWHGTILPIDDPWWDTHYPPCGWNCRCTTMQLDAETIAENGWEIGHNGGPPLDETTTYTNPRTGEETEVPAGIDPGFAYNVGKAWLGGIEPPILPEPALPDLDPGVVPRAKVPIAAPEPDGLLPEGVSPSAAIDAFLDGVAELGAPELGTADIPPAARPAEPGPSSGNGGERPSAAAEVERGKVVSDAAGWPLPVGPGWFRDAGGELAVPAGDRRRVLGLVGRAIARPGEIRWRWVTGADGTPMLFRRYIAKVDGLAIVVDIGRLGWRFATARDAGFDLATMASGDVVWSAR